MEYTLEMIKDVIPNCSSKTDFHKKYSKMYYHCKKMGWLDQVMPLIPRKIKWDVEKLKKEAKKYKTKTEFMSKNISAYNTALKSGHYDEIISHMTSTIKWDYNKLKDIFNSCNSLKELRETYGQGVITIAKNKGWYDNLSKHLIKFKRTKIKWTFDEMKEKASKCTSRKEFGEKYPSAYQKALKLKLMDELSIHMKNGYTKWTKEKINEILSDSPTLKDLRKKCPALFIYIKRHKLEKEYFS
jgi:hypothetical protein